MNIAMIFPDRSSESAISNYTLNLIEGIEKSKIKIKKETYTAGKPLSLFKKILNFRKYDVIHIQHEYNLLGYYGLPFFILPGLLKLFTSGKIILTMHNVLSQKEKFEDSNTKIFLRRVLYNTQNRFINWSSDKIIVHCHFFKNILVKEYGFNKEKLVVIPQAIIEGIETLNRKEARKELSLSGNVYLIIGTFGPLHGADIIVRQANEIGKTILIATNPHSANDRNNERILNYLELNKNLIQKNNLKNMVRLDLKKIPFDLWWKYFSASDLVLLPYRGGIGSGIFSDAIAMNIPMVGSNIPYFREFSKRYGVIKIAKNNNFSKAIKNVMKSKEYLKIKKSQVLYTKEFGINSIGKKYKNLYNSII
jgi:glycosyltransferase involved in cell wall biosynthesis